MPLIPRKKGMQQPMDDQPVQKPSIAIAYNIQRKNKKKMNQGGHVNKDHDMDIKDAKFAEGGDVDSGGMDMGSIISAAAKLAPLLAAHGGLISAKEESRPMPGNEHMGKKMVNGEWIDDPANHMAAHDVSSPSNKVDADFDSDGEPSVNDAKDSVDLSMETSSSDPKHIDADHDEDDADARYADGGEIHPKSVAEACMMKRKRMAKGGEVDLSENAEEHKNMEDDLSFEALKKENYSESDGLDELDSPKDSNEHGHDIDSDKHDMISSIRKKIKSKRGI